jgi:hypothetical protein
MSFRNIFKDSIKHAWIPLAALVVLSTGLRRARADVVYDNNTPSDGAVGWMDISSGYQPPTGPFVPYAVSDSFTISSATRLASVDALLWVDDPSAAPLSVDWSIGTSAFDSSLGSGTSSTTNSFFAGPYEPLYDSSFSVTSSLLAPGTYYLTLGNAVASDAGNGGFVAWDISNGPSIAIDSYYGPLANIDSDYPGSYSESFAVSGSATPDQSSTFLLFGFSALSLLGIASHVRKLQVS